MQIFRQVLNVQVSSLKYEKSFGNLILNSVSATKSERPI